MNRLRRRILEKIAQTTTPTDDAATPAQGAQPPTPTAAPGPNNSPSPLAHELNPYLNTGWGPYTRNIDTIIGLMDKLIITGTNGQQNFKSLYLAKFQAGVTGFDQIVLDAISLSRQMFAQYLNNGNVMQKLANNDMKQRAGIVNSAPELSSLTRINPASKLGESGVTYSSVRDAINTLFSSIPNQ